MDESKVLVIYTGGTIGMLVGQQGGYVPEPLFLTETLRSQKRFHDPLQESLYSHSNSVQGFRQWSNGSGGSSPVSDDVDKAISSSYLLVRSSRPIGQSMLLAGSPIPAVQPLCRKVAEDVYEADLPSLVTPRIAVSGNGSKRIRYAILEWNPLRDSCNMEIKDWIRIATEIELNYSFDAFVILHGTDTMTYTSSALTFLLEDLGKTVILTGAQIPLSQLRNDAVDNLLGALSIAGHFVIPECCLYFNHTLFRGNRVSKFSSFDLSAFSSPNFPPLVNVGIDIIVNWNEVIRQTGLRRFRAHKNMSPHVATLRLFPGITSATVRAFLMPPIRGVVLETYGAGNAPQQTDFMAALKEARDRGVVIVAISQCAKGSVSSNAYESGRTLLQAGVVPGADMTPECALTKLSYLLSKPELTPSEVRDLMCVPLRGELTRPSRAAPPQQKMGQNLESIQGLASQFVRLSSSVSPMPKIVVTTDAMDEATQAAAKPWSWTAAEVASTEAALVPFLIHLAAARDDVECLRFCLSQPTDSEHGDDQRYRAVAGGVVNCLDPTSGRSPLHVAALNGSVRCASILLEFGALVHLRDSLGHTSLYYAARQGHESIVDNLMKVGANLGGSDLDGGFVALAFQNALHAGDQIAINIWAKAGMKIAAGQDSSKGID